jgi:hypothetical protein
VIDLDDLADALAGAIGADAPRPGQWPNPATAGARRLRSFRDAVRAFLEDTPGEVLGLRAARRPRRTG